MKSRLVVLDVQRSFTGSLLLGGVLGALAASPTWAGDSEKLRSAVEVRASRIDGATLVGHWLESSDGHSIKVQTTEGTQVIPIDDLARLTFGMPETGDDEESGQPDARATPDQEPELSDSESRLPSVPAVFHLADGGYLRGRLLGLPEPGSDSPGGIGGPNSPTDGVLANTPLGASVYLIFDRLAGIQLVGNGGPTAERATPPVAHEAFRKALRNRLPGHDVLITRDASQVKTLRGYLEAIGAERGSFAFGNRTRTFKTERIFGVVLAAGAVTEARDGDHARFTLSDGSVFSGRIERAGSHSIRVATSLGFSADLPLATTDPHAGVVTNIRIYSSRVVYLSDLAPAESRTEGLLHRPWPIHMDQSVSGGTLSIAGRVFEKGVGVHSLAELSFSISGTYEAFAATIGIDDVVRPRGSVVFRIRGDDTVLFDSGVITGTDPPRDILVDLTGVERLTLAVDYGDGLDLSDHADWGDARLLKPAAKTGRQETKAVETGNTEGRSHRGNGDDKSTR